MQHINMWLLGFGTTKTDNEGETGACIEARQPSQKAQSRADSQDEAGKPKPKKQQASETPKREWERDTGNGPITAQDMATFT